jgi:hypothetical protein
MSFVIFTPIRATLAGCSDGKKKKLYVSESWKDTLGLVYCCWPSIYGKRLPMERDERTFDEHSAVCTAEQ